MTADDRRWAADPALLASLVAMPGTELKSLLLELFAARAHAREPADVLRQYARDAFTWPAAIDLRAEMHVEQHLLAAAADFTAVALSPLAPLGACVAVAPARQNKIVSTTRMTEVASDSTNLLALECARRLQAGADEVRLAACQRIVRAQPVPSGPGYAPHFKLFALATAGRERADHGLLVEALAGHIRVLDAGLEALARAGYATGNREVRLFATPARAALVARVAESLAAHGIASTRAPLEHTYYDGLRFHIDVTRPDGVRMNLADGGAFDWVARLTTNRRHVFVASGLGTQLLVMALGA